MSAAHGNLFISLSSSMWACYRPHNHTNLKAKELSSPWRSLRNHPDAAALQASPLIVETIQLGVEWATAYKPPAIFFVIMALYRQLSTTVIDCVDARCGDRTDGRS